MIDAKELRIGNLVYDEADPAAIVLRKVSAVVETEDDAIIKLDAMCELRHPADLKGVPLTDEMLTVCFDPNPSTDKEGQPYLWGKDSLEVSLCDGGYAMECDGLCYFPPILCLHQLQNLYRATVGKELDVDAAFEIASKREADECKQAVLRMGMCPANRYEAKENETCVFVFGCYLYNGREYRVMLKRYPRNNEGRDKGRRLLELLNEKMEDKIC